jgi:hypothetical protein
MVLGRTLRASAGLRRVNLFEGTINVMNCKGKDIIVEGCMIQYPRCSGGFLDKTKKSRRQDNAAGWFCKIGGGGGLLIVCPTARYLVIIYQRYYHIPQKDTPKKSDARRPHQTNLVIIVRTAQYSQGIAGQAPNRKIVEM